MRAGQAIHVTMFVPGLLGPGGVGSNDPDAARALVDGLDLRALDRLLARAECTVETTPDDSVEALAFRAFGYEARPVAAGGLGVPDAGVTAHPAAAGGPGAGAAVCPAAAGGSATGDAPRTPCADWPVAAVTALVDCEASTGGTGSWLRADPVHLHPDIADLVLFDAVDAGVSSEEARALVETVNEALRPGGPVVDAAHPHRWYVTLEAPARMTTTPLSLAAGTKISAAMPHGPDAPRWRRWMNEVQMALHECPVNVERERRGAAPINSVWPWGGGSLPPAAGAPVAGGTPALPEHLDSRLRGNDDAEIAGTTKANGTPAFPGRGGGLPAIPGAPAPAVRDATPRKGRSPSPTAGVPASWGAGSLPPASGASAPFVQAWSDDALVRGLACHAGIECGTLPGDAGAWLDPAPRPGAHLIAFDALYRAARRSDLDTWRAGLARFSASWAKPLLDAQDRGAVARVSIHDERGHRFAATRWGRFRWWRRGGLAARIAGASAHRR